MSERQEEAEGKLGGMFLLACLVFLVVIALAAVVGAGALREIAAQRCPPTVSR